MRIINFASRNFLKLSILSWIFGLSLSLAVAVRDRSLENFLSWKMAQYYVNYFDFGFVKRGLIGTLLYPMMRVTSDDRLLASAVVVLLDLFIVFAGLIFVKRTFEREPLVGKRIGDIIKCLLVFSPIGVMELSYDVGRFDHVTIILAVAALILIVRGSYFYAGLLLAIGILVHEAVFVFAFPVLLTILIAVHNDKTPLRASTAALRFATLPIVCAAAVLVFGNSNTDLSSVLPSWAQGGTEVWQRGLLEPRTDLTRLQYALLAFYALAPFVFLMHFYRSNALPLDRLFLAPWCAFLLFALGIDYSRWCHLLFVSNCLVVMSHLTQGRSELKTDSRAINILFFTYVLPLGPLGTDDLLPYVEFALRIAPRFSWVVM